MLRYFSVFLLLIPFSASAQPGEISGFGFMRVEASARAAALGGSLSSVCCDDLGAFFHNPAILNSSLHGTISVSYLNHLHDLSAGFAAYSRDLGQYGTASVGLRFMYYGSFDRTDEEGNRDGSFSASDIALTIGLGRQYGDRWRYGANINMVYSGIDSYSATALLADVGATYHSSERQFTVSASVNSAGLVLSSLGSVADKVPLDLRLSISKGLRYVPLFLTLTAYNLHKIGSERDGPLSGKIASHAILGLEFRVISAFAIRAGYNHRRHQNLSTGGRLNTAGASTGFGLRIRGFALDYAYSSWSFAGLHQFTLTTSI